MELELTTLQRDSDVTLGELFVDGVFFCFTCEDTIRPEGEKIYGQTAIPRDREYDIALTFSNRFQQIMPLVKDVPGFEGIRIHPGNTAADTNGCILVGDNRLPKGVGASRVAYARLFALMEKAFTRGEEISLRVNV